MVIYTLSLSILAITLALPLPQAVAAEPENLNWSGKVVQIIDGDSLVLRRNGKRIKIRLDQVDCPEPGQPFGRQAKRFTTNLALGKKVDLENVRIDPFYKKRYRATIILPDGRDLEAELVKAGLAWNYPRYSKNPLLPDLEQDAKSLKLGLWSQPKPQAPWSWRKSRQQ